MIAGSAEKAKVQNTILGKEEEITCDSVAKINSLDYETCKVEFEDNTAKVTIKGSGKFEGLYVCNGDKTSATATTESCTPAFEVDATFANNSWDKIIEACQTNQVPESWNFGDTKTMTIGENEVEVAIIGKNHDTYADGGVAPLTFMTKQVIGVHSMNSTDIDAGSWSGSEMYSYLNNTTDGVITTLSADVQAAVKPVVKSTNRGRTDSGDTDPTEVVTSNDKLFLLSPVEVFGPKASDYYGGEGGNYPVYALEGSQYDYFEEAEINTFKQNSNAIIPDGNTGTYFWWLRSPYGKEYYGVFTLITIQTGTLMSYHSGLASSNWGVAFGFCF